MIVKTLGTTALTAALLLTVTAHPAEAKTQKLTIGVVPTNGDLVMYDETTQISVAGTPRATVYIARSGKWVQLGPVTPKQPLSHTFDAAGVTTLRVVPASGKAKVFKVPVYARFGGQNQTPTQYGGVIINDSGRNLRVQKSMSASARAASGCVAVDIGAKSDGTAVFSVSVLSQSEPLVTFSGSPVGVLGTPVGGDSVVEIKMSGDSNWYTGVVWTCLTNPRV